jgi:hypothetical protein
MKQRWWIAVGILGLSGCGGVAYETAFTIYPPAEQTGWSPTESYRPPVVDSLKPTLRWRPVERLKPLAPDDRYDILVHEAYRGSTLEWAIGRKVYYREGLNTSNHTLEIQLAPNQTYYWAVRVRRGQKPATEWSSFIYFSNCSFIGTGCKRENFPFFLFVTPAK